MATPADCEHLLDTEHEDAQGKSVQSSPRISKLWLGALALAAVCALAIAFAYAGRRALLAEMKPELIQKKYSTSTSYCYEDSSFDNCWSNYQTLMTSSPPQCTAHSATLKCICSNEACVVDELDATPPTTGRCAQKTVYVKNGTKHNLTVSGAIDITGTGMVTVCSDMVLNDQWQQKGLTYEEEEDEPPTNDKSYWSCWHPNTWKDGKCQRKERFLGESCWDGSWGAGSCVDAPVNYDEYSTACYKGKCVPIAYAQEREECSCAWFGWNFIVACSAADGQCGGHACVLNTGDGKKYCDYNSDQNW